MNRLPRRTRLAALKFLPGDTLNVLDTPIGSLDSFDLLGIPAGSETQLVEGSLELKPPHW